MSGDQRRQEITEQAASERQLRSTCSRPTSPAGGKTSQDYDFTSPEARERFEELLDQLRQQLMQSYVNQMAGAMQNIGPEQMQRMKDMLAELNQMLDQRERGEDPATSRGSWSATATSSPRTPQTLDELLEADGRSAWRRCRRCSTR